MKDLTGDGTDRLAVNHLKGGFMSQNFKRTFVLPVMGVSKNLQPPEFPPGFAVAHFKSSCTNLGKQVFRDRGRIAHHLLDQNQQRTGCIWLVVGNQMFKSRTCRTGPAVNQIKPRLQQNQFGSISARCACNKIDDRFGFVDKPRIQQSRAQNGPDAATQIRGQGRELGCNTRAIRLFAKGIADACLTGAQLGRDAFSRDFEGVAAAAQTSDVEVVRKPRSKRGEEEGEATEPAAPAAQ